MAPHEPFRTVKTLNGKRTIVYHLYISDTTVNYTGKKRTAIAVNGQLPGPTLEFTEGDTAEDLCAQRDDDGDLRSLAWTDRAESFGSTEYPFTAPPIRPMETYVAKFALVQNGTYWYHSHTMLQEQIGLYGALVIHKRKPDGRPGQRVADGPAEEDAPPKEQVALLSDWTDEKPYEVQRSLHYATDWYAIRKGSTQDYAAAIKTGHLHTKLTNEWKRMLPMDVSDVYYNRFLVNGQPEQ